MRLVTEMEKELQRASDEPDKKPIRSYVDVQRYGPLYLEKWLKFYGGKKDVVRAIRVGRLRISWRVE
jgi:hypothetical protein